MRWGELAGLRPGHIDFLRRVVTVQETIVEISKRHSPTGDRNVVKPYHTVGEDTCLSMVLGYADKKK